MLVGKISTGYLLHEHNHIVWQGDLAVNLPILSIRQFISANRAVFFYELIQRRGCTIPGFYFHRDHSPVFFEQEFKFMKAVRFVIIKGVSALA